MPTALFPKWIYRSVCGIAPDETAVGFKRRVLAPCPDRRLGWVKGEFSSAAGVYESEWAYEEDGIRCQVRIPLTAPRPVYCAGWNGPEGCGWR